MPQPRRRLDTATGLPPRVLMAIAVVSLLLAAMTATAVWLAFHTATASDGGQAPGADVSLGPASPPPGSGTTLPPNGPGEPPTLAQTSNPIEYARSVTAVLFTWSTTSPSATTALTDIERVVVADADPSGVETNGLVSDLTYYLPSTSTWQQLATYSTQESVRIEKAYIPGAWGDALAEGAGQIAKGTTAVTIEAVRIRQGIWLGEATSSEHPVSFTAFVACPPAFDRCHLLRLSQVDKPLK